MTHSTNGINARAAFARTLLTLKSKRGSGFPLPLRESSFELLA